MSVRSRVGVAGLHAGLNRDQLDITAIIELETGMECCSTWDGNVLLAETVLAHARLDGFPVTPGHTLVIPKRHVVSFTELTTPELLDVRDLIADVCQSSDADSFTIGINDGPDAGRTIDHLHIHVIPRRAGDVPDPRGGVRRVLIPEASADPWVSSQR